MSITQQASGMYVVWGSNNKQPFQSIGKAIRFVRSMGCTPVINL